MASSTVMYIGPNIVPKGLKKHVLYRDGIPETFNWKPLNTLFVTTDKIIKAEGDVVRKGTPLYKAYQEISNYDWSDK